MVIVPNVMFQLEEEKPLLSSGRVFSGVTDVS